MSTVRRKYKSWEHSGKVPRLCFLLFVRLSNRGMYSMKRINQQRSNLGRVFSGEEDSLPCEA